MHTLLRQRNSDNRSTAFCHCVMSRSYTVRIVSERGDLREVWQSWTLAMVNFVRDQLRSEVRLILTCNRPMGKLYLLEVTLINNDDPKSARKHKSYIIQGLVRGSNLKPLSLTAKDNEDMGKWTIKRMTHLFELLVDKWII